MLPDNAPKGAAVLPSTSFPSQGIHTSVSPQTCSCLCTQARCIVKDKQAIVEACSTDDSFLTPLGSCGSCITAVTV